ncbi:hypothetical protein DFH09DRAFT_1328530 [Mycena vulgaris]|nr:hypothetical protein DFH09DRAFT_1328530 [Mycena vulgaris]
MPSIAKIRAANAAYRSMYTPVSVFAGGTSGIGVGTEEAFARHTQNPLHLRVPALRSLPEWAWIHGLLPALRAADAEGEYARAAAVHTASGGGPIDLADLGLKKAFTGGCSVFRDLMVEGFAERNPWRFFTHTHPGAVDTPLLRNSPAVLLCLVSVLLRIILHGGSGTKSIEVSGKEQLPSVAGATDDDIGLGLGGDATPEQWEEARRALWDHSVEVVVGVQL